ncbi:hypothetical protein LSH36_233g01003 [Paralvinella palmiformis]|uniref:Lysosomal dipeptide transporter MFSD1 n=1 Tax=Paralvinella palmiformis TaxID=53620 RepID=A0AAD9JMF5_9ANNE|nr:hypothetical protein LSH36_233g01003 [Paralvinella palmiformis]
MEEDLNLDPGQYMGFYSWYSWPNVVLCFFGGYLIDKVFGVRLGAIVFSVFVTVGQCIFGLGALLNRYWLMCLGRFVFGIGGESLCVAQNNYAVNWFKGRELNMVFGLQLSFSRVGSTVNMNTMKRIYALISQFVKGYVCLGISLFIASGFCVMSLICALLLAFFDKRSKRILNTETFGTGEVIRLKDVKDFNVMVWLLCTICVCYYVTIFPFIGLGLVFLEMKYQLEPSTALACNSVVFLLSAVVSPLFGLAIDKTGRNVLWVILGIVVTLGCHATFAFTFLNPFVPMVFMGLAYSVLASALWPMVALVVPEYQLGTAYGIMQSVQNLGLATISLAAGAIVDKKGYLILEVFFQGWLCVGVLNRSAYLRRKLALEESVTVDVDTAPLLT